MIVNRYSGIGFEDLGAYTASDVQAAAKSGDQFKLWWVAGQYCIEQGATKPDAVGTLLAKSADAASFGAILSIIPVLSGGKMPQGFTDGIKALLTACENRACQINVAAIAGKIISLGGGSGSGVVSTVTQLIPDAKNVIDEAKDVIDGDDSGSSGSGSSGSGSKYNSKNPSGGLGISPMLLIVGAGALGVVAYTKRKKKAAI